MLQEFKDFIMKGNILEIAVGLIMALYFQQVVDAVMNGVLFPIIAGVVGEPNFDDIGFTIGSGDDASLVSIGVVISAIVRFVIIAFVLFLILKAAAKVQKPKEEVAGPSEVELLIEIRDQLRSGNN